MEGLSRLKPYHIPRRVCSERWRWTTLVPRFWLLTCTHIYSVYRCLEFIFFWFSRNIFRVVPQLDSEHFRSLHRSQERSTVRKTHHVWIILGMGNHGFSTCQFTLGGSSSLKLDGIWISSSWCHGQMMPNELHLVRTWIVELSCPFCPPSPAPLNGRYQELLVETAYAVEAQPGFL